MLSHRMFEPVVSLFAFTFISSYSYHNHNTNKYSLLVLKTNECSYKIKENERGDCVTKRQEEVLQVIALYIDEKGYAPSMRELAVYLNVKSVSTVYSFLESLKRKGYVTWEESKPRTLQVLKQTV